MRTSHKHNRLSLLIAGSITIAAATLIATPPGTVHKHGTDILHFFVRKAMTNEGAVANATARIEARQNQQGNANNQNLNVTVNNLEPNTTYTLLALLNDDTNLTQVAEFSSNAKGRASLLYRQLGNGKGLGQGKLPLPAALNPVSLVRALAIFNSSTQAVLTADLSSPDKLQYLIKRDLSTNTVEASLRIKATTRQTQFKLLASGLNAMTDYFLVLNGSIAQQNSTDAKGRLLIDSLLENPGDILDLRSVAVWDSTSNSVVSTTLP
jgi:hypothetical protein